MADFWQILIQIREPMHIKEERSALFSFNESSASKYIAYDENGPV